MLFTRKWCASFVVQTYLSGRNDICITCRAHHEHIPDVSSTVAASTSPDHELMEAEQLGRQPVIVERPPAPQSIRPESCHRHHGKPVYAIAVLSFLPTEAESEVLVRSNNLVLLSVLLT
jgi:hypothetical protein